MPLSLYASWLSLYHAHILLQPTPTPLFVAVLTGAVMMYAAAEAMAAVAARLVLGSGRSLLPRAPSMQGVCITADKCAMC